LERVADATLIFGASLYFGSFVTNVVVPPGYWWHEEKSSWILLYTGFKPKELVFKHDYQKSNSTYKKVTDTDENKDLVKLLISIHEQKR
jgi:hypothetical protein